MTPTNPLERLYALANALEALVKLDSTKIAGDSRYELTVHTVMQGMRDNVALLKPEPHCSGGTTGD